MEFLFNHEIQASQKTMIVIIISITSLLRKEVNMNTKSNFSLRALGVLCVMLCGQLQAQVSLPQNVGITDQESQRISQEPGAVVFSPPKGWHMADPEELPPHVRVMVVGKGKREFPPSINLSTEEFEGTLKDYLKIVKEINNSQGSEWKDLGTIRTQAGEASLSQAVSVTEWGKVRMMHVILSKNGMIYILTAAAHFEEFPKFYKMFFDAMRSLRVNQDPDEMAHGKSQRVETNRAT